VFPGVLLGMVQVYALSCCERLDSVSCCVPCCCVPSIRHQADVGRLRGELEAAHHKAAADLAAARKEAAEQAAAAEARARK